MGQVTKAKLLARVRRLRGQVEALERALDGDAGSPAVLMLLASVRGATTGLAAELMERHILRTVDVAMSDEQRGKAAAEFADLVRTYLK